MLTAVGSYDDDYGYDLPITKVIEAEKGQLDDKCAQPGNVEGFILYLLIAGVVHRSKSLFANHYRCWDAAPAKTAFLYKTDIQS